MTSLFDLSRPAVDPTLVNEKVMAVDFGKNGGFAWNEDGVLKTYDMPKDREGEQDNFQINRLIGRVKPKTVYGENVHAMPSQGVVSVATFMRGQGAIIGICIAWKAGIELIEPAAWTRWYDIGGRKDFKRPSGEDDVNAWKHHLHDHAQKIFPNTEISMKCADAVLLWNYALNPQRVRKLKPPTSR